MEITVISRETIKPSSPTPPHLKHLKLSFIDQNMPATFYTRVLLFYSAHGDAHRFEKNSMSRRLKRSLSEVLTVFYPVAGKVISSQLIDCNDDGLEYIEARVKAPLTLSQLLTCPKAEELDQLFAHDVYVYGSGFKGLSAVQVTVFDNCGGMAIGVSLSHALADGSSLATFINSWAALARRGDTATTPSKTIAAEFHSASIFPPKDMPELVHDQVTESYHAVGAGARKILTKRFVFPQLKICALKGKFEHECPTRVEVVTSLIIKCLLKVNKSSSSKSIVPLIVMNLRTRMSPPLPTDYFGNILFGLVMKQLDPETPLNGLGVQLRKLKKEIDGDYVERLQANNSLLFSEAFAQVGELYKKNDVRVIRITSFCRFPFHEADIGWGAPTWTTSVYPNGEDGIMLLDAKNGDGIEAWVSLEENDMAQFESDKELLEFVNRNSN